MFLIIFTCINSVMIDLKLVLSHIYMYIRKSFHQKKFSKYRQYKMIEFGPDFSVTLVFHSTSPIPENSNLHIKKYY